MLKKIRAQQVVLDMPTEEAEVWVQAIIQTVYKDSDYKTSQTVDRTSQLHRQFSQFAMQMLPITDPVTGASFTISGAGVGVAISEFVKAWMLQDIPNTTINTQGDVIQG